MRADGSTVSADGIDRALDNLEKFGAMVESKWATLEDWQRWAVGSSPVVLIVLWWGLGRLRRRNAARNVAAATAALVAPSEEYLEQMEAQGEETMDGDNGEQQYEGAGRYEPHEPLRH
ncbi:MAG TPA: hypothetical protein VFT55_05690 [Planctomycetota bacterium]|nr:hypothetical protein [Planctomycetota bacterium]